MQELIEKILKKLNEAGGCDADCEYDKGWDEAIGEAIEIIKQAAEEYVPDNNVGSNEWIPVSERLPEEHKLYDITFKNSEGIHSDSAIYIPYKKKWYWDADEVEEVENEIIAWAEKRKPYHPKGE